MKYCVVVALFIGLVTSTVETAFFPGFNPVAAKVHRIPQDAEENYQAPVAKPYVNAAAVERSEVPVPTVRKEDEPEKIEDSGILPVVEKFARKVFEAAVAPFSADKEQLHDKQLEKAELHKKAILDDRTKVAKPKTVNAYVKDHAKALKIEEIKKSLAVGAKNPKHVKINDESKLDSAKQNSVSSQQDPDSLFAILQDAESESLPKLTDMQLPKLLKPNKQHCGAVRCKVPPRNMNCKIMRTRSEAAGVADLFCIKEPVEGKWDSCCPLWFCYNSGMPMFYRVVKAQKGPKIQAAHRPPRIAETPKKAGGIPPKKASTDLRIKKELNRRPAMLLSVIQPLQIQSCNSKDQGEPLASSHNIGAHHYDHEDPPNHLDSIVRVPSSAESAGVMGLLLNSLMPNPDVIVGLYPIHERELGTMSARDIQWEPDRENDAESNSGRKAQVHHFHR